VGVGALLNLPQLPDLHTSLSLGEVRSGRALPLRQLEAGAGRAALDAEYATPLQ
jgi:hypothetical protein